MICYTHGTMGALGQCQTPFLVIHGRSEGCKAATRVYPIALLCIFSHPTCTTGWSQQRAAKNLSCGMADTIRCPLQLFKSENCPVFNQSNVLINYIHGVDQLEPQCTNVSTRRKHWHSFIVVFSPSTIPRFQFYSWWWIVGFNGITYLVPLVSIRTLGDLRVRLKYCKVTQAAPNF